MESKCSVCHCLIVQIQNIHAYLVQWPFVMCVLCLPTKASLAIGNAARKRNTIMRKWNDLPCALRKYLGFILSQDKLMHLPMHGFDCMINKRYFVLVLFRLFLKIKGVTYFLENCHVQCSISRLTYTSYTSARCT